jgi:hypothetical protein
VFANGVKKKVNNVVLIHKVIELSASIMVLLLSLLEIMYRYGVSISW